MDDRIGVFDKHPAFGDVVITAGSVKVKAMRYHLLEEEPPRVPSVETDMRTVAYRTWQGWDNVAIGNRGKRVPDTICTDFTSPNVYTSWDALDKFYSELEQVTCPYREYTGFSGSGSNGGAELICNFFAEHERYKCHIEQKDGRMILVKDEETRRRDA